MSVTSLEIYTDGSSLNNGQCLDPDDKCYGGWAYQVLAGVERLAVDSGNEIGSSNQRMELKATIEALKMVDYMGWRGQRRISLLSDSAYVLNGINNLWFEGWMRRGWRIGSGKPASNVDLWKDLIATLENLNEIAIVKIKKTVVVKKSFKIDYKFIKGHSGNPEHDFCDVLARDEARKLWNENKR